MSMIYITPKKAEEMLQEYFANGRKLRKNHVNFLAKEMELGRFAQGTQIRNVVLKSTNESFLVDGQHRLAAVVKSGKGQNFSIVITQCGTMEEVSDIYMALDQGLKRNVYDTLMAYGLNETSPIPENKLKNAAAAIRLMYSNFRYGQRIAPRDVYDSLLDYQDAAATWYDLLVKHKDFAIVKYINNAVVSGSAIITLHSQKEKATEFWTGVLNPWTVASRERDVRYILHNWILSNPIQWRGRAGQKPSYTPHQYARYIAQAWNVFYNGQERKRLLVRGVGHLEFNGTPYTTKRD